MLQDSKRKKRRKQKKLQQTQQDKYSNLGSFDQGDDRSRTSSSDNYSISSGFQENKILLTDAKYDAKAVMHLEQIRDATLVAKQVPKTGEISEEEEDVSGIEKKEPRLKIRVKNQDQNKDEAQEPFYQPVGKNGKLTNQEPQDLEKRMELNSIKKPQVQELV